MVAYVEEFQIFLHVSANKILVPAPLVASVVSVYFPVYVHLSLHLLRVPQYCAVEASGPATFVLVDVGHRVVLPSSQCDFFNQE